MSAAVDEATELVGRDDQIGRLHALLDGARERRGGALALRGEAGIGKSALLAHAAAAATGRGMLILSVAGVQAEVRLPYAGLQRLLHPLRAAPPEGPPLAMAEGLLELLGARDGPVLLAVEDAQWLDEASWEVLTFAARRLSADRIAVVLTAREGDDTGRRLGVAGLPECRLEPLGAPEAGTLLDRVAPGLPAVLRERVLDAAAGNPLGLVELGTAVARTGVSALLPNWLPLSTRVEQTFSALVAELPAATRALLLVAALDDGDDLDEVLTATTGLGDGPVTAEDAEPAAATRLIAVDDGYRLRFRHPLLRSAVQRMAGAAQRRRAHAALAAATVADPDRQLWHLAAAATGPDEKLARRLTEVSEVALRRHAIAAALAGLERAARLSPDPADRARRLLGAADAAHFQGDAHTARRLLRQIEPDVLRPEDFPRFGAHREFYLGTGWSGSVPLSRHAGMIDGMRRAGDPVGALRSLAQIALRVHYANVDGDVRSRLLGAADGIVAALPEPGDRAALAANVAMVAPIERGRACLAELTPLRRRLDLPPEQHAQACMGANALGAFDIAASLGALAVPGLRDQGRLGSLAQCLTSLSFAASGLGDARRALAAASEAESLAAYSGQGSFALTARLLRGLAHALDGDTTAARELADAAEAVLLPGTMYPMLALVQRVRGVAELADGRPEQAFQELLRMFLPDEIAYHPYVRLNMIGHLAEAAVLAGRLDGLREIVALVTPPARESGSPAARVGLTYAAAVLAGDEEGFRAALATGFGDWRFDRARTQLAYGAWLRRHRRAGDSRPLLREAAATFDALGTTPWAGRARDELRASGETRRRPAGTLDALTPQEQQIARLAAAGLSNRDIAERMFLSPRTVSTHLYRIYPKVGVRTRGELAALLATGTA